MDTTPSLPLTLPDGQPVPPPPAAAWREHTAGRFREQDAEGYAFACYLVRELGITNKSEIVRLVDEHRAARQLEGISRNTIIALMNDPQEFKAGEIEDIIKRRSLLTSADALDKVEELLNKAKSAKDLGAAAMALTSVYNVKQLSSGGATRISGNTQDSTKAKGFDHFMQLAQAELQKRQQTVPATALPDDSGRVVIEAETVAENDPAMPTASDGRPLT
jgi:hypothetical protein